MGKLWVLRVFPESAKEQAFERVRQWAPCRIRVMGEVREEWRLEWADVAARAQRGLRWRKSWGSWNLSRSEARAARCLG